MHTHTEFGITNSKSEGVSCLYATDTIILEKKSEVKVNSDHKIVLDTLSSQDAPTYQSLDSFLK